MLDELNNEFHAAYEHSREDTLGAAPILILIGDVLTVYAHKSKTDYQVGVPQFHLIKVIAHIPPMIFSALVHQVDATLGEPALEHLANILRRLDVDASPSLPGGKDEIAKVLESSIALLTKTLADKRVSKTELDAYAERSGPLLSLLAQHATAVQLACLHTSAEQALLALSADERRTFEVVVAGDHQARTRSLGMQYFELRLGEKPGADGRVTFGEAVTNVEEAITLVETRRFDRVLARAFFGDENRLQRDVLGDAAKQQLSRQKYTRI